MSDLIENIENGIATLTFNRPERLNALSKQVWSELEEALRTADADAEIHAIILTGSGRAFSSVEGMTSRRFVDRSTVRTQWSVIARTS